jgi:hypothetical protein
VIGVGAGAGELLMMIGAGAGAGAIAGRRVRRALTRSVNEAQAAHSGARFARARPLAVAADMTSSWATSRLEPPMPLSFSDAEFAAVQAAAATIHPMQRWSAAHYRWRGDRRPKGLQRSPMCGGASLSNGRLISPSSAELRLFRPCSVVGAAPREP